MIKLLLSGKQLLLFIIVAWSLLAFISYNVLTVEAATKEKYDYDSYEEYNEIIEPLCNDKGGKLNHGDGYCYFDERDKELQFEKELDDRGLGADYTAEEEASWNQKAEAAQETSKLKDVCKKMDGEWKDSECKFKDGVEMGKPYSKEQYQVDFEHYISDKGLSDYYYEEIAAQEDAICDNEDASITNIKLCMSDEREQEVEEREESDREMYSSKTFKNLLQSKGIDYDDYNNGKLSTEKQDELETEFREDKSDEYAEEINSKKDKEQQEEVVKQLEGSEPWTNYPIEQKPIEDWSNTVSDDSKEQAVKEVIKQIEDSEEGNEVYGNAGIDYTPDNDETDDSESEEEESSEEEDNSGDDSSSSDDGGDSSESEE